MTKISKKSAYPIKIPVRKDYFVGSDSENNGKTINFDFESGAKLIGEINGSTALSYRFRTDSNIDLTVLTEGVFLSAENETTIANISKLYINKNNFHETNMSDLFRFVSVNRESFLMKLRNSSNLSNAVYFRITDATEFESYFILDVAVEMNNASLPELINFNVYFFDFELSSSDLAITLPEFNKIVTQTGYTSTETTITFNPSWTWLIKNVSYANSASVVKTIAPATTGKKRIDVFVLNTSNTFETISGEETTGSPVKPQIPADTLEVTFCIVGDTGINIIDPVDISINGTKAIKTYFINSEIGNNISGIYQDYTKPFATIDYVLSLPTFKTGDIIFLQNNGGTFPLNGLLPNATVNIFSDLVVTLDFSGNNNANILNYTNRVFIDLKKGTIKNDKSGGVGCYLQNGGADYISLSIIAENIYHNCSNYFAQLKNIRIEVNFISVRNAFLGGGFAQDFLNNIVIKSFNCLGLNSSICQNSGRIPVRISNIIGVGSYYFGAGKTIVGNISTTGTSIIASGEVHFENSTITSAGGIVLGGDSGAIISGVIVSTNLFGYNSHSQNGTVRLINFVCDFKLGYLKLFGGSLIIENSSIKSTNSPIAFQYQGNGSVTLKNSVFEVVNAVPLITCGVSENRSVKIAGISTNATILSEQIGTGVTITQFTNY